MKILAIDTSTEACSAAIADNQALIAHQFKIAPQKHTQLILPMIDELLKNANMQLTELNALAFGAGPGSFTGLRIAAGVIQGLAFGLDLPVVPISTLRAMAQGAYRKFQSEKTLAALDARMNQIYWGVYQISSEQIAAAVQQDTVIDPQKITMPENTGDWTGVGAGWKAYSGLLEKKLPQPLKKIQTDCFPDAQDIAYLASLEFKKGNTVSAEQALPVYLREKVV